MGLSTEDVLEIQGLAARYCHAVDSGDTEGFAGCYTEDGVFEIVGLMTFEGHDAIKELAVSNSSGPNVPRHVASNLVIEGDGDRATMKAYIQIFNLAGDPPSVAVATSGTYDDNLAKGADGRWKFTHRRFAPDRPRGQ